MKVINLTEGMRFGIGVDGLTEEARATAIDFDGVVQGSDGQAGSSSRRMCASSNRKRR